MLKNQNREKFGHHPITSNYFGRELIRRPELEVRVEKLKNKQAVDKDEVTGGKMVEVVQYGF